ncbi:hypothetical protein TNCT_363821 [Trichonephila clavata]|uniref:Uncharacterized protein n=1 Tax=Trichonephila clavata TaxID=2740835 RepID=A0A8X6G6P2_TRICU|nr:hypothetical protein TNCT_363821 [Trichonephila clavata]
MVPHPMIWPCQSRNQEGFLDMDKKYLYYLTEFSVYLPKLRNSVSSRLFEELTSKPSLMAHATRSLLKLSSITKVFFRDQITSSLVREIWLLTAR